MYWQHVVWMDGLYSSYSTAKSNTIVFRFEGQFPDKLLCFVRDQTLLSTNQEPCEKIMCKSVVMFQIQMKNGGNLKLTEILDRYDFK